MFSCCCYKKKSDIREPLISVEEEPPRFSETKVPFSKVDKDEEVKPAFSNTEYLNRIAEAKLLEKRFKGTVGSLD
jgi:hypothetical protein